MELSERLNKGYIIYRDLFTKKYLISFVLLLISISLYSQSWEQASDFPATERDDGVVFVIGDIAYCGTGLKTGWVETSDFYSLDMISDTWTTIESLPLENERQYASGFSSIDYGFVFGGINDGEYLDDIWKYDPVLDNWIEKSPMPSVGRSGAASFTIDDVAYIIGGRTSLNDAINEVWAYNIVDDSWQQKSNLPFGACFRASASSQNDKGYLLFGKDENNNFYFNLHEYDPDLDTWTELTDFPDIGRSHSTLISFSSNLVVVGGIDTNANYYNDMWRFNLELLIWEQLESMPSLGRKGGLCFNNETNIYYTTGIDEENNRLKETWKYVNPTGISEFTESKNAAIYPNPAQEKISLELRKFNSSKKYNLSLLDCSGKKILTEIITKKISELNLSNLSEGLYFIQIQSEESLQTLKLIKQ